MGRRSEQARCQLGSCRIPPFRIPGERVAVPLCMIRARTQGVIVFVVRRGLLACRDCSRHHRVLFYTRCVFPSFLAVREGMRAIARGDVFMIWGSELRCSGFIVYVCVRWLKVTRGGETNST